MCNQFRHTRPTRHSEWAKHQQVKECNTSSLHQLWTTTITTPYNTSHLGAHSFVSEEQITHCGHAQCDCVWNTSWGQPWAELYWAGWQACQMNPYCVWESPGPAPPCGSTGLKKRGGWEDDLFSSKHRSFDCNHKSKPITPQYALYNVPVRASDGLCNNYIFFYTVMRSESLWTSLKRQLSETRDRDRHSAWPKSKIQLCSFLLMSKLLLTVDWVITVPNQYWVAAVQQGCHCSKMWSQTDSHLFK